MKLVLLAAVLASGSTVGLAATPSFVLCQAQGKEDIILELDSVVFATRTLSCVRGGGGFYYDMTPCAPDGGYGLSDPSSTSDLSSVVDDWRDFGDHIGGVVEYGASPTTYFFAGGRMSSDGYIPEWRFIVSRLTGIGDLGIVQEIEENGAVGWSSDLFDCRAVQQKF